MLTWLGIKSEAKSPRTRQFFSGVSKKTVIITLASALAVMIGVRVILVALLPSVVLEDPVGAVVPGFVGLLMALIRVGVVERLAIDQSS